MSRQWDRYQQYCLTVPELDFSLDVSRVQFPEGYIKEMLPAASSAMDAMEALEAGALANADEGRMVGHYWLRAPGLAPSGVQAEIRNSSAHVSAFAEQARLGAIRGAGGTFMHMIHVGIGGSSLGAQLLCETQKTDADTIKVHFLDNIDPDGIRALIRRLQPDLGRTLVSVVSKSGWTPTPWRVMTELEGAYASSGLSFARHAVATTMAGTKLDSHAVREGWLARFPLWDWVGGRTSITSAVGLLPAALQGVDVAAFLDGAAKMDERTRARDWRVNPAMMLALMWYWLGNGRGDKTMVILPYRDRLALLPRYVQQLVMESIGKRLDRSGKAVHQGLSVYGHKGVTDQHSYLQQLCEGRDDAFVTFIAVDSGLVGDDRVTATPSLGDHLFGNLEGTRAALSRQGRDSITINLASAGAASLGALVALYERAVGLYAELVDVNAYHQPSVDKDVAAPILGLKQAILHYLPHVTEPHTAEEIAAMIGQEDQVELVYKILRRQALLPRGNVRVLPGAGRFAEHFTWCEPAG
jgi:glucose-6-phosphate isomerase